MASENNSRIVLLETNILLSTPIDKNMKKFNEHPVIRKKIARAKETLGKVKNLHEAR
jgi:hypothetical protein